MTSFVNSSMFRPSGWRLQSTQDSLVLAVRIVVALLRAAQLVAVEQHGHAEREHQRGEEGAFGPLPLIEDPRVVGGPFGAAAPREVVVLPSRLSSPLASLCFSL